MRQEITDMVGVVRSLGQDSMTAPSEYTLPLLTTREQILDIANYTPQQMEKMVSGVVIYE